MSYCDHPNMKCTARRDYCPDCEYEFYYGDAHATGEAQISKEINPGRKRPYQEPNYNDPNDTLWVKYDNCRYTEYQQLFYNPYFKTYDTQPYKPYYED